MTEPTAPQAEGADANAAQPQFTVEKIYLKDLSLENPGAPVANGLERIEGGLRAHPGLYVAGNSYQGVAINSCVAAAAPLAERVLAPLGAALVIGALGGFVGERILPSREPRRR